jgi:hypothetical protein
MSLSLAALRQTPQIAPARFLALQPGCWVQYFDDTPAKEPGKALGTPVFYPTTARRKQAEQCAVCFSLQVFARARTREEILCYRNLGVDVDLITAAERRVLTLAEIDERKNAYLAQSLWPFPLRPHWIVETRHGFHLIFRILPQTSLVGIRAAFALNGRLVRALKGDEKAVLLTQVLRVPGTYQFKDPRHPFLCRLLLDNTDRITPYTLDAVRDVLNAWEIFHSSRPDGFTPAPRASFPHPLPRWRAGLAGVREGNRNAMAACLVGGLLCRLPEALWETGGWGGLKEWNARNPLPLPERELRRVYESIARHERARRNDGEAAGEAPRGILPAR